ncbi:hypothetical protein BDR07DRAFT_1457612 [Suillus spraguei]|nr:hypothetical protein BDR07DRAFT_1457612 [Suillus spraguei]
MRMSLDRLVFALRVAVTWLAYLHKWQLAMLQVRTTDLERAAPVHHPLPTREKSPPPPRTPLPSSPAHDDPRHPTKSAASGEDSFPPAGTPRPIAHSTKPAVSSPLAAPENLPAPPVAPSSGELMTSDEEEEPQPSQRSEERRQPNVARANLRHWQSRLQTASLIF